MLEKKLAREPSRFGSGAIEGVAAPEAANNAAAQTGFIPTLTLGIPGSAVMALLVGAMIMQGLAPGPGVIAEKPELFWGIVASMWLGNLMLLVLNLSEEHLRRAMLLARGDPAPFFTRPTSLAFMLGTAPVLAAMIVAALRRRKAA